MYVAYDSIEPSQIPASAPVVMGYVGGRWPDYEAEVRRFPHARHVSIAVNASEFAEMLDVETGDATDSEAPGWFHRERQRGVQKPILYRQLSGVGSLLAAMHAAGIARTEYRLLSAHYTHTPHICSPADGCPTAADGTQWTDRALGRNLDESLLRSDFFASTPRPKPYVNGQEVNWLREKARIEHRKGPAAAARRQFLRAKMKHRMYEIVQVAEKEHPDGWGILNRTARYEALKKAVGVR